MINNRLFVEERVGRLMRLEEHELSRYEFEIWFEYTRRAMSEVREGAMLAVENFATLGEERHLSILEITSLKPVHYALGDNPDGYPAFVMEAARNASQDWVSQEDRSEEDTTIIRCTAIPTDLELVLRPNEGPEIASESNIPMIGADARLLDSSLIGVVVNRGIDVEREAAGIAGTLVRDSSVDVLVRVEDLLKVHFGIFGFTGAGKSNLVSTLVSTVIPELPDSKVVLFDLMGEYGTLLIDRLNAIDHAYIICLGERSLPQRVFEYMNRDPSAPSLFGQDATEAAEQLVNFFLLPKALLPYRERLIPAFENLLITEKVRVFSDIRNAIVDDVCDVQSERNPWRSRTRGRGKPSSDIEQIVKSVFGRYFRRAEPLTPQLAGQLYQNLESQLSQGNNGQYQSDFEAALGYLREVRSSGEQSLRCSISRDELHDMLDDPNPALFIVLAHYPDELRRFSKRLGEETYERRRQTGRIQPSVSFIFDEADEFIPQQAGGSYQDSKAIAETLARRGRKFGLGLGIATQRIRYLDTSIMAQPHTYLVSKLPRRTDREAVAEAFGMSDEMLRQTFTFQAGNWLLVSHDATGLKAVPVPISTRDANARIIDYLDQIALEPARR